MCCTEIGDVAGGMGVIGKDEGRGLDKGVALRGATGSLIGRQATGRMMKDKTKQNKRGDKIIATFWPVSLAPLPMNERGAKVYIELEPIR